MSTIPLDLETDEREAQDERREIARRRSVYARGRAPVAVEGRTAIVVDDGIATGITVRAALAAFDAAPKRR